VFVPESQVTPPPTVLIGQVATERNVSTSLLFNVELENGRCDAVLPAEEMESWVFMNRFVFSCLKYFL
jgi:hypothetical protein